MKKITKDKNGLVTKVQTIYEDKSLAQQQFKDRVNVNSIMKKYQKKVFNVNFTGVQPMYGDFSEIKDYQGAMNAVVTANDNFMSLPSDLRLRFNNNPGELLAFVSDKKNYDEATKLGLVKPKPEASPKPQTNPIPDTKSDPK